MGLGVEAVGISKSYDGKKALLDVSLKVEAGELFAVLGPSGGGKSTLLRILNMLERPDAGGVRFTDSGSELRDGVAVRRRMTLLLQRPVMLKDTVFNNVAYGLRIRAVSEEQTRKRVSEALSEMGLEGFERRRASSLSGGEMQRVAFARAIVLQPEVIMLDEFTANLDPPNIKMLETAVTDYRERTGCTVILVSHNPFQARRMVKECIFLYQGRVIANGSIEEVQATADDRVEAFFRGDTI